MGSTAGIEINLGKTKRKWSANEPLRTTGTISFESEKMFKELIQTSATMNHKIGNMTNKDEYEDIDYYYNDDRHEKTEGKGIDENEEGNLFREQKLKLN